MQRTCSMIQNESPIVVDLDLIRYKGCGKRLKSAREKAIAQSNRKCSICQRRGHDKRICTMLCWERAISLEHIGLNFQSL